MSNEHLSPQDAMEQFAYNLARTDVSRKISDLSGAYIFLQGNYYEKHNIGDGYAPTGREIGFTTTLTTDELELLSDTPRPIANLFKNADTKGVTGIVSSSSARLVNEKGLGFMVSKSYDPKTKPRFMSFYTQDFSGVTSPEELAARKWIHDNNESPTGLITDHKISETLLRTMHRLAFIPNSHPYELR